MTPDRVSPRCPTALAILAILAPLASWASTASTASTQGGYPIQAVAYNEVHLTPGFWAERVRVNGAVSMPHALAQCASTGRIDNFSRAAGTLKSDYVGFHFNDSDVYKVVEGLSRQLALTPDPLLGKSLDEIIGKIAAAQQKEGYIHPFVTVHSEEKRWQKPELHELFSMGHLIEAGAVNFQASGKRGLLEVAIRAADCIDREFKPGIGPLGYPPEHQQAEIGLVKLFEVTKERKYLELAKRLLEARGRAEGRVLMGPYCQDHEPVSAQREAVGHAVRAVYQYSAMADVAAYTGDAGYRAALEAIWKDVFEKKVYLTGGLGASGGNEGFSKAYDLPNVTAYSETCAAIGSIMWNERMFRLTGQARFMDVVERTLFNALLSGVSGKGDGFFYPNRLETFRGARRSAWFDCACCPSNVVRFMPWIPELAYAVKDDVLYVNQFMSSEAAPVVDGQPLALTQQTDYPWAGKVSLTFAPTAARQFTVMLRIPDWARAKVLDGSLYQMSGGAAVGKPSIKLNGQAVEWTEENGYARIERNWQPGDLIEFELPTPVRHVVARAEVAAATGRVALQRGPLVYCAEGLDQSHGVVMDLVANQTAATAASMVGGLMVIKSVANIVQRNPAGVAQVGEQVELNLRPYYSWANREATPMQVWLAATPEASRPAPAATLATTSKVTTSSGASAPAVNDQLEPRSSGDVEVPLFHWWPKVGSTEWVEYEFAKPASVTASEVYWFDDSDGGGGCKLPQSWRLLYRHGQEWKPVDAREVYTTGKDRWSRVSFQSVTTTALRLEVVLPAAFSAGIHEWKVEGAASK